MNGSSFFKKKSQFIHNKIKYFIELLLDNQVFLCDCWMRIHNQVG